MGNEDPLHTEIRIEAARVVTGREDETAVGNSVFACATNERDMMPSTESHQKSRAWT